MVHMCDLKHGTDSLIGVTAYYPNNVLYNHHLNHILSQHQNQPMEHAIKKLKKLREVNGAWKKRDVTSNDPYKAHT